MNSYLMSQDWAAIQIVGMAAVMATVFGIVCCEILDWLDRIKLKP